MVSWLSALLPFTSKSHNSGNFHSNEKNKISESKLKFHLFKKRLEIKQKAFRCC